MTMIYKCRNGMDYSETNFSLRIDNSDYIMI